MKIAIMGAGHMGSWLAKALSKENEVAVYDIDKEKAATIKEAKQLDSLEQLGDFSPQMLINAVSIRHTVEAFRNAVKHLPKDCILCDVTSVKTGLEEYYRGCGFRFVSIHPMFGPTFANMESLRQENMIVITGSDPEGAQFFKKFFGALGLTIFDYSFDEHDLMMAYSFTTPIVASLMFAACMKKTAVPGSTFAKHKKLAEGVLSEDDHLLAEILFNEHSIEQLDRIAGRMEYLKHIIKSKDRDIMKEFLNKLRENIGSG